MKKIPELESALDLLNNSSVINLFRKVTNKKIICTDISRLRGYCFDTSKMVYKEIGVNEVIGYIREDLVCYLAKYMNYKTDQGSVLKLLNKIGTLSFLKSTAELMMTLIGNKDQDFVNKLDADKDSINFRNGLIELKTGKFRKRTEKDYVTKYLDYDYTEKRYETEKKDIINLMMMVYNNDPSLVLTNLSWFGYCLTGHISEQKFMALIGHGASNGKSTMSELFQNVFDIYSFKAERKTFSADYQKKHKQYINFKKPTRYIWLEEIDKSKLDVDVIKDIVSSEKLNVEIMYGTSEILKHQCKLNLVSNYNLNFDTDNGIKRRGLMQNMSNKFLDKDEYDAYTDSDKGKGIYLKDLQVLNRMKSDKHKNEFVNILLPFTQIYYKHGLHTSMKIQAEFTQLCSENDKMSYFIEKNFEKTNKEEDRIQKDDFVKLYRENNIEQKAISWKTLLNDVKRLKLVYKPKARGGKNGFQGCIVGIKQKKVKDQYAFDDSDDECVEQEPIVYEDEEEEDKVTGTIDKFVEQNYKKKKIFDVKKMTTIIEKYCCCPRHCLYDKDNDKKTKNNKNKLNDCPYNNRTLKEYKKELEAEAKIFDEYRIKTNTVFLQEGSDDEILVEDDDDDSTVSEEEEEEVSAKDLASILLDVEDEFWSA